MKHSEAATVLIEQFEGKRNDAYPDPATGGDPWTIGLPRHPSQPLFDLMNKRSGNVERAPHRREGHPLSPHFQYARYIGIAQFCGRMTLAFRNTAPISILATAIFSARHPFKIFNPIVRAIGIQVIDRSAFERRTQKRFRHHTMNKLFGADAIALRGDDRIPAPRKMRAKERPTPQLRWLTFARRGRNAVNGSNATKVGDFKPTLPANDLFPNFFVHGRTIQDIPLCA